MVVAAVLLAAVAFAGSFEHVRATVAQHGQGGWLSWAIAAMPEVSVALVAVKLRRDGARQPWAWLVGGSAMVFTALANLAQAEPTPWGYASAVWPVWASVGAAGLIELQPSPAAAPAAAAHTSGPAAVTAPAAGPGSNPPVEAAGERPVLPDPGDRPPVAPPGPVEVEEDLLAAARPVVTELQRLRRAVNYKNLAPALREQGHQVGRAKAEALIAALSAA